MTTAVNATRLISIKATCSRTSLSRTTLHRMVTTGEFPRPVSLHGPRKAFIEAEVDAWIAKRIAARVARGAP